MPCYAIDGIVPVIDPSAFVHDSAVLIGDVIVGPGCYVGPLASLRGVPLRCLVAGGPAKVLRELSEAEIAWKHAGTLSYQDLTRRSLASLHKVEPLRDVEADRPRLQPGDVKPLIAQRRG